MMRLSQLIKWCKERKGVFAIVATLAGMNVGCSTPQVPYVDPNPPDTAWYAYQQCLNSHPGIDTTRSNVCDHAGDQYAQGYYYGASSTASTTSIGYLPNYNSNGECISFSACYGYPDTSGMFAQSYRATARQAQPSIDDLRAAYREHLKTLDAETLRRLSDEWLALSAAPNP